MSLYNEGSVHRKASTRRGQQDADKHTQLDVPAALPKGKEHTLPIG
jgi:hypothetical protein